MPPSAPPSRRTLGIDPGTRVAGWGVVETSGNRSRCVAYGTVRTKSTEMASRLVELRDGLAAAIAEHSPDAVAVETQFFGKNARSALAVGMARGIALLVAADAGAEVHEYTPAMVKRAVVGNGNAAKEQVGAMVRVLLGLAEVPKPADAADALAIALTHIHRAPLAALTAPPATKPKPARTTTAKSTPKSTPKTKPARGRPRGAPRV